MTVLSFDWLLWMVLTVAVYWAAPARFREPIVVGATVGFLAFYSPVSAAILVGFTVAVYVSTNRFAASGPRVAAVAIAIVAVLVFYKLQVSFRLDGAVGDVVIPLGLSYYSFRCLHYLIEKYKGTIPRHGFEEIVAYLMFLPTMAAGPIHRFREFRRDLRRKRWDTEKFAEGIERILYGYVKIAFLANYLVDRLFASSIAGLESEHETLAVYLTMLRKGLNGYLQFAGYSDIAIGFALLLGYRVMENFNWPFLRRNIAEFWRSWHISLSSWCREYVYMVVISVTRRPALAALATMLVFGLWHEISLRYLLWGAYNGLGIVVWQGFQRLKPRLPTIEGVALRRCADLAAIALTFHFVMLGFVLVQEDGLAQSLAVYQTLLLPWR
ncbi:MAG: MBOAT family O-acyltransferase [Alphaproteobacteria bacterium]